MLLGPGERRYRTANLSKILFGANEFLGSSKNHRRSIAYGIGAQFRGKESHQFHVSRGERRASSLPRLARKYVNREAHRASRKPLAAARRVLSVSGALNASRQCAVIRPRKRASGSVMVISPSTAPLVPRSIESFLLLPVDDHPRDSRTPSATQSFLFQQFEFHGRINDPATRKSRASRLRGKCKTGKIAILTSHALRLSRSVVVETITFSTLGSLDARGTGGPCQVRSNETIRIPTADRSCSVDYLRARETSRLCGRRNLDYELTTWCYVRDRPP